MLGENLMEGVWFWKATIATASHVGTSDGSDCYQDKLMNDGWHTRSEGGTIDLQ